MDRYTMNASNGSVVPIESANGDWVKIGEVDALFARLKKAEEALREIRDCYYWKGAVEMAEDYFREVE